VESREIEWDDAAFDAALEQAAAEGVIEAKGVLLSSERLAALLKAAPRDPERAGLPVLTSADFTSATFGENVRFSGAKFGGYAGFDGASFRGDAGFEGVIFGEDAGFSGAKFGGEVRFDDAAFAGSAWFSRTAFDGDGVFIDATFVGHANFSGATFGGAAEFPDTTFGYASFGWATFGGPARFVGAKFTSYAGFETANFGGDAEFHGATFSGSALFDGATFCGSAQFNGESFSGAARFSEPARFNEATFRDAALFNGASFSRDAGFENSTFSGLAGFEGATFAEDARFAGATFERAQTLGPILVAKRMWLDRVVFAQRVVIEASALRASFARAVFRGGADVRLRWAEVWFEDTDFAEPSLVAGLQARLTPKGDKAFLGWEKPSDDATWASALETPPEQSAPHVLSIRGARVTELALAGVNLRACRFAGAHGLDELTYENAEFAESPSGWRWIRWQPVRWAHRRTIAEERYWRAEPAGQYGTGWDANDEQEPQYEQASRESGSEPPVPWPPERPDLLGAEQIAGVYRELRKGREDKKDEPGAADFYYGEMEMRRHSAAVAERSILWLYWLFSGYGLRASRALVALVVLVGIFTSGLYLYGFRDRSRPYATAAELRAAPGQPSKKPFPPSLADVLDGWGSLDAWTYSAGTATAVIGAPDAQLTQEGRAMRIPLRLLGPILIGLGLLAIRGRVKR
jgi:uncharacterized protein YjbI with pentapeptide repeats